MCDVITNNVKSISRIKLYDEFLAFFLRNHIFKKNRNNFIKDIAKFEAVFFHEATVNNLKNSKVRTLGQFP